MFLLSNHLFCRNSCFAGPEYEVGDGVFDVRVCQYDTPIGEKHFCSVWHITRAADDVKAFFIRIHILTSNAFSSRTLWIDRLMIIEKYSVLAFFRICSTTFWSFLKVSHKNFFQFSPGHTSCTRRQSTRTRWRVWSRTRISTGSGSTFNRSPAPPSAPR